MKIVFSFKKNICTIITSIVNVIVFAEFYRFFNFQYNYFIYNPFRVCNPERVIIRNLLFLTLSGFLTLKGLRLINNLHFLDTYSVNAMDKIHNLGFIISKTLSIKVFCNSFVSVFFSMYLSRTQSIVDRLPSSSFCGFKFIQNKNNTIIYFF